MYRKTLIALAAVTALAVAIPLDASVARGSHGGSQGGHGGGGYHGGGGSHGASIGPGFSGGSMRAAGVGSFRTASVLSSRGNWRGAGRHHFRHHRHFFIVTAAPYYYYDDGCYQLQQVPTRWGWRWQRVWVCY